MLCLLFYNFFIKHICKLATINHNLQRRMNTIEIRLAKKEDAQFIALLGRITFSG
jgi:hypothetical protein